MLIIIELIVCLVAGAIGAAMGYSFWAVFFGCLIFGVGGTALLGGTGVIDLGGDGDSGD